MLSSFCNVNACLRNKTSFQFVDIHVRVKQSGSFRYASVLPQSAVAQNPTVKITRVSARPDPPKVREFADDVRDGEFVLPIGRRMPLRDAAQAHCAREPLNKSSNFPA